MMSTEENKRVVQSLFEAFGRGDIPAVLDYDNTGAVAEAFS